MAALEQGPALALFDEEVRAEFGDPARFSAASAASPRTLVDVLDASVRAYPDEPALDDGHRCLTYRALAVEVEALRRRLSAAGVGLGDRVGVRVPSGTNELYVAILAVLAAGAAYVPVDAEDPDERAELVFGEAGVRAVVGAGHELTVNGRSEAPAARPGVEHDAWIIFTSGSTGKPKGVAVSHRSAAAFVDAEAELFLTDDPIGPGDRVMAGLSVAFDASCEEMWLAWRYGACLVPVPRSQVRSGADLGSWLVEQEITVVSTVPTLASLWEPEALNEVTAADLRRRGLPARAGAAAGHRGPRGLEHLRAHRGHRRRLRLPDDRRGADPDRAAAERLGAGRRRRGRRAGADGRQRSAGDRRGGPGPLSRPREGRGEVRPAGVPRLGARLPQR